MRKLLLILMALPGVAGAQIGPINWQPTVDDCRDPDYLADASFIVQSWCADILGDAMVHLDRQARLTGRLDNTETAQVELGLGAIPNALASKSIEEVVGGPPAFQVPAWVGWELNGNRVESCDEYVFQRYHTYHRFVADLENAPTGRAAFDRAFDPENPHALGFKYGVQGLRYGVRRFKGNASTADQAWDPLMALADELVPDLGVNVFDMPKNDFFALTGDEMAMLNRRDANLANAIDPGRHYYRVSLRDTGAGGHPNPWQFQLIQALLLDGESDAEMQVLAGRRARFQELLAERRALRRQGLSAFHYKVRNVDNAILAALRQADDDGCLDIDPAASNPAQGVYDRNRCDWAPDDLLPAVVRDLQHEVDHARAACERVLPNPASVANGYTYRTSAGSLRSTAYDPFKDSYQMQLFVSRMGTQERYYLQQAQAGRVVPVWQQSAGRAYSWGSRRWAGADFDYNTRWGLGDRQPRDACDINPQLHAEANASASMFGNTWDILHAEADFDLRRDRRVLDFELLGRDYLNFEGQTVGGVPVENDGRANPIENFSFNLAYDPSPRSWERSVGGSTTLYIVGIPFTLSGSLVGRVGVDYGFGVAFHERTVDGECEPTLSGDIDLRPFAGVNAFGSVGPGLAGFSGGVYIDVNLLDASLPATAAVDIRLLPQAGNVEIEANAHAELQLHSLEGEVGGYVQTPRVCIPFVGCAGGRYSKSFASWSAVIEETFELFDVQWTLPLNIWTTACDRRGVECAG